MSMSSTAGMSSAATRTRDDVGVTLRASVLIPTHGDASLLRMSLPELLRTSGLEIEVLVVNNDPSQDVRVEIGDVARDPRIRIVEMGCESDFPSAINRGIRESTGELVMLCNADLREVRLGRDEIGASETS